MTGPNPDPGGPPVSAAPPPIPPEPPAGPARGDGPHYGSIVVGLAILAVGLWYFADRTLGLSLPRIDADQLWPLAVIALGVWLVIRPHRSGR